MNPSLLFHQVIYRLLTNRMPIIRLGNEAGWSLDIQGLNSKSFVISAGAGYDISFELDLVSRSGCSLVLLDPSPTGCETVSKVQLPSGMFFEPMALSDQVGRLLLAKPLKNSEGSWRIPTNGNVDEMPCTTITEIMMQHSVEVLDLLKIDIEGFEYQVLEDVIRHQIPVRQICVEIHQGREFKKTRYDRWKLIFKLYKSGYRIIHHDGWDHTFLLKSELAL
jgi:FkbM family methyltransferase